MMVEVYCQTILVAGNETTRNGISAAVKLFAEHPDQYQRLLDDETLIDSAVEEILRYHNPTIGFIRTAKCDTEIRGTTIARGEHVYMIYGAGNRDPEVFPAPDNFDIGRFRKRFPMHLTFGFGEHVCIGSALARLEMRILLGQLRSRFAKMELVGEPEFPQSLLGNGFVKLPVRFTAH
jgi:cytochrome P450